MDILLQDFWNKSKTKLHDWTAIMARCLKLADFKFVTVNAKKQSGYYSFKTKDGEYEICIDLYYYGWLCCLCNKWEEVLCEKWLTCQDSALKQANFYYRSLKTMVYK
jgi:hypothetical protein